MKYDPPDVYAPTGDAPQGERYEQLCTLVEMKKDKLPLVMIRHNQLCLWHLRQRHLHPEYENLPEFPGWKENFKKFVMIHYTAGRA